MDRRGKWFQGILTLQMLIMLIFAFGIIYNADVVCLISLIAWGWSVLMAQTSYDNLLERIEDLEKKKEDDENGD